MVHLFAWFVISSHFVFSLSFSVFSFFGGPLRYNSGLLDGINGALQKVEAAVFIRHFIFVCISLTFTPSFSKTLFSLVEFRLYMGWVMIINSSCNVGVCVCVWVRLFICRYVCVRACVCVYVSVIRHQLVFWQFSVI